MPIEDLKVKPEILSPKPPSIATDEEFASGTSTTASPTVKQAKENLVTIDTVQTITTPKIFTADQRRKSTVIDVTTQPENYTANNLVRFLDKNDKITGYIENAQLHSGQIKTGIHARNKDGYQHHVDVIVPPSGTTGAYATAPNTPANAPDNAIVTAGYLKNDYVTLKTNQTITSTKTYTVAQNKKSPTADISTTPDDYQANEAIRVYDKNNNVMGIYHTSVVPAALGVQGDTGEVRCAMDAINKDGYQAGIRVNIPVEGKSGAYAACPTYDEDKSPSNAIVTKGKIANMVTTNTAQIITATKIFNYSTATSRTDVYIASQASDSYIWSGSLIFKKGDLNTGFCESFLKSGAPTKDAVMQLTAHHNVKGTDHYANLAVGVRGNDGTTYALAPTPPVDGANDGQILTNKWFNSKMQVVSALPANPDPNVFYFIPE